MTADQLLSWFGKAAPGERIRYYRGNLGIARAEIHSQSARQIVETADMARSLGVPTSYAVLRPSRVWGEPEFGQGVAHLTQRRVEAGSYEYFITKAGRKVLT